MPGMGAVRSGLASLHKALAVEWARYGVTTCAIAPGATDTPGLKRYPGADVVREVAIRGNLQGRLIDPKEVAWLFLVMASPLARCVNGYSLLANCGDSLVPPVFKEFEFLGLR